jgi:hypothetical protein
MTNAHNMLTQRGKNIYLKSRSCEKLRHRISQLTKWIFQIDHYSEPTIKQLTERDKYLNQKNAMLKEIETRCPAL